MEMGLKLGQMEQNLKANTGMEKKKDYKENSIGLMGLTMLVALSITILRE